MSLRDEIIEILLQSRHPSGLALPPSRFADKILELPEIKIADKIPDFLKFGCPYFQDPCEKCEPDLIIGKEEKDHDR